MIEKFKTGDLIEVTRTDGKKFKGIVIENYGGGFVSSIINKDDGIGTTVWERYGRNPLRFQITDQCESVKVLSEAKESTASSTFSLNESISKDNLTYYTTPMEDGTVSIFCMCEGYGGWSSYKDDKDSLESMKESYLDSKLSKICNE